MTRLKVLVLALFAAYWMIIAAMVLVARPQYDQLLKLSGNSQKGEVPSLVILTAVLAILSTGVIRGWRWTFWLILLVFLAGVLRAGETATQLIGMTPHKGPVWYVVLPGMVGLIQFAIAIAMIVSYRKVGPWGRPSPQ
ncbi:hypothetical protein MSM1_17990 [Mycobacterium sp. SM1]|uniref:hypothetical protein n=1 Tax=Mycobacterium sp. SM1 TaxID=2816243 RepID=UPI001BCE9E20|nr:hypothetical protein [Mycobacterium sp. SM1]MBS4730140.1 hypothetical protein [Mycobacterium sp. SM1]